MLDRFNFIVGSIASALVVIAIAAAITYGVNNASQRYYERYDRCIQSSGTWVPLYGGGYSAICVNSK